MHTVFWYRVLLFTFNLHLKTSLRFCSSHLQTLCYQLGVMYFTMVTMELVAYKQQISNEFISEVKSDKITN